MQEIPEHDRVGQAVHNNAVWCDTICRTHGHAGEFVAGIWINRHAAPPFYPNAVTLAPDQADEQLAAIRSLMAADVPGAWAVKDSFAALDLAPLGFRPLFDAAWLWRAGESAHVESQGADVRWSQIESAAELAAWEIAWRGEPSDDPYARIFLPALLEEDSIAILAAYRDQQIVAGAIANRTGQVVGLSNVFVPAQDAQQLRAGCVAAVQEHFLGLSLVGYESGADLAAFQALGFEELGPLRIWSRRYED
ncbi:MAG TPA: hypothetical protein VGD58_32785 [Herpetosiphonaceae bacterium]